MKKESVEVAQMQTLMNQNKEMQQQISSLTKQLSQVQLTASVSSSSSSPPLAELLCDFCGGDHKNGACGAGPSHPPDAQVNFVGGPNYSAGGFRNHPNFSWRSPALNPPQEKQPQAWENAVEKLAKSATAFAEETRQNFRNPGASIKNLQVQVGQIAKQLSERPQGSQPRDIVP